MTLLATQGVQVHFHFLPTTEHADCRKEASGWHHSVLLADDLAIPGEEDLGVGVGKAGEAAPGSCPGVGEKRLGSGPFSGDTGVTQA